MNYDDYIEILKDQLLKKSLESSFSFIVGKFSFLAWGPIAPIAKLILKKILVIFIEQTELATYLKFIDFRTSKQGRTYYASMEAYQEAVNNGEQDKLKELEEALKRDFKSLVVLTN